MANSYNKIDKSKSRSVWKKILEEFKPYSGFEVDNYYGVSLIKRKRGGMYSIKLIHDYDSNAKFSSALEIADFQRAIKYIEILEWFAKDEELRPKEENTELDLDAEDDSDEEEIDF